jgi:hypothetical protein
MHTITKAGRLDAQILGYDTVKQHGQVFPAKKDCGFRGSEVRSVSVDWKVYSLWITAKGIGRNGLGNVTITVRLRCWKLEINFADLICEFVTCSISQLI